MGTPEVAVLYFNNDEKSQPLRGIATGEGGHYGRSVGFFSERERGTRNSIIARGRRPHRRRRIGTAQRLNSPPLPSPPRGTTPSAINVSFE
jgi:hypothetical protein